MPAIGNVTCLPMGVSSAGPRNFGKDDLDALLYIVVTLLFYSMGIIIGIITYLKREQAEMEEDKMFDTYMQLRREPFNVQRKERVQKMALYLEHIEEKKKKKAAEEKMNSLKAVDNKKSHPQILERAPICYRCALQGTQCSECQGVPPLSQVYKSITGETVLTASDSQSEDDRRDMRFLSPGSSKEQELMSKADAKKRVVFPDYSHVDASASLHPATIGQAMCIPMYNLPSVHSSQSCTLVSNENPAMTSLKNGTAGSDLSSLSPMPFSGCVRNLCEKRGEESMELGQLVSNIKHIFKESSFSDVLNPEVCREPSYDLTVVSPAGKPVHPVTSCPCLYKQSHFPRDGEISGVLVQTQRGRHNTNNARVSSNDSLEVTKAGQDVSESGSPTASETDNSAAISVTPCNKLIIEMQQPQQVNQTQQLEECRREQQQLPPHCQSSTHDQRLPPSFTSTQLSPDGSTKQGSQSLLLPNLAFRYLAPPHSFPGTQIFRCPAADDSVCSSPGFSNSAIYDNTSGPKCPPVAGINKSRSQNFQISGVTKTRELGLEWRSKTKDKRQPRNQPERRGALFFTQRSFQKDPVVPKTSDNGKQSRAVNVLKRQASVDLDRSGASDKSERAGSHKTSTNALFCTPTSGDSNSALSSTPDTSHRNKHRLTSSLTLDSIRSFYK